MSEDNAAVTALVAGLFVAVAALLAYGMRSFQQGSLPAKLESLPGRQVNMRLEVLWTGCAAFLLFAVFLVTR
jgi:heme/copper-type cytochrome/quinol oxidase subunit 2